VVVDGVAYAVSDGRLGAFDARAGSLLWYFNPSGYICLPVVTNGVAYAGFGDHHLRGLDAKTGTLLWEFEAGDWIKTPVVVDGVAYAGSGDGYLRAFDVAAVTSGPHPGATWSTDTQFWSYVIWGKGGLAVRKITDGFGIDQILRYDNWTSRAALADEIDRLAALGDWDEPEALAQDPATLCPPEFASAARSVSIGQGVRPAAQFCLCAAQESGSPARRLEYAEEALRLAPEWDEATAWLAQRHHELGNACSDEGHHGRAISEYDKAIELQPDAMEAHYRRGNAYLRLGETARAFADYDRAVELEPGDAGAYCARGLAHSELGHPRRAIVDYTRAAELDAGCVGRLSEIAGDCCRQGDPAAAVAAGREAVRLAPDDSSAVSSLGLVLLAFGADDEAVAQYHHLASIVTAHNPEARDADELVRLIAELWPIIQVLDAACADLQALLAQSPELHLAHFCLGLLHEGADEREEAAERYRAYLNGAPDGKWASEAQERLDAPPSAQ